MQKERAEAEIGHNPCFNRIIFAIDGLVKLQMRK